MNDRVNWYYRTEPQARMNGRRLYWPRGRVLGGSSSLNAMVYIRGHALDYDRWVGEGAAGWSYAEVLPYFRRAETFSLGADAYRGGDGPLTVTRGSGDNPLFDAWIERRRGGRLPRHGRHERLPAGGHGADGHDHPRTAAAAARRAPICARPWRARTSFVFTRCLATRILLERGRAVGRRVCRERLHQAGRWRRAR